MVEISVFLETEAILTRELGPGEYSLGRLPENDLVLNHHEVSRRHARLVVGERGEVSIEDLGSTNGVMLEGGPVTSAAWLPGQTVVIKPYELRLRALAPAQADLGGATVLVSQADPHASATVVMEQPLPRLLVRAGQASEPEFRLPLGVSQLGRSEDCQIRLSDASISRHHAQIEVTSEGVFLRDLGSSGGTLLNGQKVSEAQLNPGDQIGIGPVVLELSGPEGAAQEPKAGPARKLPTPAAPGAKAAAKAAAPAKSGGKKLMLVAAVVLLLAGGAVAVFSLRGGPEKAKPPEPVAAQVAQDQQRQEEEERRRIVIISLTKAREAYMQGQLQAAIPLLNTVLSADPNHAEARDMLQKAQTALAQAEAARQRAQQEAQARAQRVAMLGQQIQAAAREGKHGAVLEIARELLALDPQNQVARDLGVKAQAALEQEEQKKRSVKAAGEKREQEAKRHYNEGVQQMQSGNLVAAVRAWNHVTEADPRGETPWPAKARGHIDQVRPQLKARGDERYAQGQAQLKAGDTAGAMAAFQEALRADPWHGPSKAALDELQAKNARKVDELMQEAEVLVGIGDTKNAVARWQQALGLVAPGSARHSTIKANISKYAR